MNVSQEDYMSAKEIVNFDIELLNPDVSSPKDFCQYHIIKHKISLQEFFALVFLYEVPSNAQILRKLLEHRPNGIMLPISFEVVNFTDQDVTLPVAIFPKYDYEINLENFINQNGPLSTKMLQEKFLPFILELLDFAKTHNIAYGNISPQNILISAEGDFILKECVSNLPSSTQPNHYLAPELIDCEKCASGRSLTNDLYALGITLYYAATGDSSPWRHVDEAEYNALRLENGTKSLLKGIKKLPEFLSNIISGLVAHPSTRFDLELLKQNSQINFRSAYSPNTSNSPSIKIYFNNKKLVDLLPLAHELFTSWQTAMLFVEEESVVKYLLSKYNGNLNVENINLTDLNPKTKLEILLGIIDQFGPIRIENFAIKDSAIIDFLTYAYMSKLDEKIADDKIIKITKIINNWSKIIKYCNINLQSETNLLLKATCEIFDHKSILFGTERILYFTNPYLHCLSDVVRNHHVVTLQDYLITLENKIETEEFELDTHLIAFLADRVNLNQQKREIIRGHLEITQNLSFNFLYLLSLAQKILPDAKLENLCCFFVKDLLTILDENLHNSNTKIKLQHSLLKAAKQSDLKQIISTVLDNSLYANDFAGFTKSCKEVQDINSQIGKLNEDSLQTENLIFYGQKVTVIFSYLTCLIISLVIIL